METGVKGGNLDDENKKETGLCVLFVIFFEFLKCHTYIIVNQLYSNKINFKKESEEILTVVITRFFFPFLFLSLSEITDLTNPLQSFHSRCKSD